MSTNSFCTQCGSSNFPDANFCKTCGIKLDTKMNAVEREAHTPAPTHPSYAGYSNPHPVQPVNFHEFPKYQKSILSYSNYTITIRVLVLFLLAAFAIFIIPTLEEDESLSDAFPLLAVENLLATAVYSVVIIIAMIYVRNNYAKFNLEAFAYMKYLHLFILITTVISFFINTPGGGLWDLGISGYCYHKLQMKEFKYWYQTQTNNESIMGNMYNQNRLDKNEGNTLSLEDEE